VNLVLWIVQILLALAFGMAGFMKATKPVDTLVARMAWAADYSPRTIKLIGVVEILGALGLILPQLTGIAPVLTPIAAIGLAIVMVLAIGVHLRRREYPVVLFNVILLALSIFIAWGRLTGQ
jgi:uncharacterized membrane protein YphA (DoxX/SURF4 family)